MIRDDKELDVATASQPPLSHPSGAEPASAVSGKAGIANAALDFMRKATNLRCAANAVCDPNDREIFAGKIAITCTATADWLELVGPIHRDLYEALRNIAAQAGAFRAFEFEIREAAGNTNWQCLIDAIAQADAAISKAQA